MAHPGTLSARALSNRIPPYWSHWEPNAQREYLGGGAAFPNFIAYHIGHPLGTDNLLPEYISLLDNYERNILFAVAVHMGRPKIAYQLLTEAICDALSDTLDHNSVTNIDCMANYVPEDMFQIIDNIHNVFNTKYICQCTKSLKIVAKLPFLV
jgi:hypothetical protein